MKKTTINMMNATAVLLILLGVVLLMAECEALGLLVMTKVASIPFFYAGSKILKVCEQQKKAR